MIPLLLYIDPGTGSALFAIIIGLAAAGFFSLRAIIIKAKSILGRGKIKHDVKNKYIIYAEDKRYWSLFKQILDEFENQCIELLYLTSSIDDPVFQENYKFIQSEFIGTGNKAFARLNFLSADFVLTTTPSLDVYQWKKAKTVKHYSHIVHSADEQCTYELFGLDYFDSILITGKDFQVNMIRKLEENRNLPEKQIITVGSTYLDEYKLRMSVLPDDDDSKFTVLVSPSWGNASLLVKFGENLIDPLSKTDWNIIIRPHPQSLLSEKHIIDNLINKYSENKNIKWDFERDNLFSLKKADIMISDFSGIILDFMFLRNKPVFYVKEKLDLRSREAYQLYNDQDEMWIFKKLEKAGIELLPDKFSELPELIKNASRDPSFVSAIEEIKSEAWHFQGQAAKRVADFMIQACQ